MEEFPSVRCEDRYYEKFNILRALIVVKSYKLSIVHNIKRHPKTAFYVMNNRTILTLKV